MWVVLIIGFLGILSTIIASKGPLIDKRYSGIKRIRKGGYKIIALGLLTISLTCYQSFTEKKEKVNKEEAQKQEASLIAKKIQNGVDSNRQVLFNELSEAFYNQEIKFDSLQNIIQKSIDSPKTVTYFTPKELPSLVINGTSITHEMYGDTMVIGVLFSVLQAEAKILFF